MHCNLILNIPHASTWIPSECFAPDSEEYRLLSADHIYMVDWYVDELFNCGLGVPVIAPASRMVCDTERFREEDREPMAKIGMGVCYSRTQDLKHSICIGEGHREWVLHSLYDVHHKYLEMTVDRGLAMAGRVLILDCHSFSPVPLPYEPDQDPDRPDICIGTDPFHSPEAVVQACVAFFKRRGYSVKVNSPYGGTIVPIRFLGRDDRVMSIMVEVNRGLYLRPGTNERNGFFYVLKRQLREFEGFVMRKCF